MMRGWIISVTLAAILPLYVMAAPDYEREQRWANEIVPGIIVGEPLYLTQQNQHKFLGIYAVADEAPMAVIVVHGMGIHPDWGLIGTLRQRLYDVGYTTLSIQMPVLGADATPEEYPAIFPDAADRLQVALDYLKKQGYERVVIVSHSNGSRMSRVFMLKGQNNIYAWVALSLTQGETFDGIKLPILDLYGELDLPHVLSSVAKRKSSLRSNLKSKQLVITAADHFFNGKEDAMVGAVVNFLDEMK